MRFLIELHLDAYLQDNIEPFLFWVWFVQGDSIYIYCLLNCQSCTSFIKFQILSFYCTNSLTVGALSCCLNQTPPIWDRRKLKTSRIKTFLQMLSETGLCSAAQKSSLTTGWEQLHNLLNALNRDIHSLTSILLKSVCCI